MLSFIKKSITIIFYIAITSTMANAQSAKISGHVIDRNLDDFISARITNLNTHEQVDADSKGHYIIKASIGDTLVFSYVDVSSEKRIVRDDAEHVNVLLIDKMANDLGIVWTKKQYQQAERRTNKYYKRLIRKAQKLGKWDDRRLSL